MHESFGRRNRSTTNDCKHYLEAKTRELITNTRATHIFYDDKTRTDYTRFMCTTATECEIDTIL